MKSVTQFLLILLLCKLSWNVWYPCVLELRYRRSLSGVGQAPKAVHMMLFVELLLLVLAVISAALSTGEGFWHRPALMALVGVIAIVCSYALASGLGKWIRR
jgi:hypothetical protein